MNKENKDSIDEEDHNDLYFHYRTHKDKEDLSQDSDT